MRLATASLGILRHLSIGLVTSGCIWCTEISKKNISVHLLLKASKKNCFTKSNAATRSVRFRRTSLIVPVSLRLPTFTAPDPNGTATSNSDLKNLASAKDRFTSRRLARFRMERRVSACEAPRRSSFLFRTLRRSSSASGVLWSAAGVRPCVGWLEGDAEDMAPWLRWNILAQPSKNPQVWQGSTRHRIVVTGLILRAGSATGEERKAKRGKSGWGKEKRIDIKAGDRHSPPVK